MMPQAGQFLPGRAAVGGLVLCRPALPANSFALAWLVVAFLNPTDMFASGCQLSFLTVAVLIWGAGRWFMHQPDELEQLEDEARPPLQRNLRRLGRWLWTSYAVTLTVWLAAAPLIAFHYHLVSPIGVLIGPPLMVLMSVALTGWHRPRRAIPGFPGAACNSVSDGLATSARAIACSRPPDPMSRTRTPASLVSAPAVQLAVNATNVRVVATTPSVPRSAPATAYRSRPDRTALVRASSARALSPSALQSVARLPSSEARWLHRDAPSSK